MDNIRITLSINVQCNVINIEGEILGEADEYNHLGDNLNKDYQRN